MQPDSFRLHLLLHSADLVERELERRLGKYGIRPRQARILDALERMGSSAQSEIAREFGVSPASMSTMTARLLSAGLISRKVDPNEIRSNAIELTNKGRTMLEQVHKVWLEIDQFIEETIGKKEAETLAELTRSVRDKLGGKVPGLDSNLSGSA
ncbi:MarR family winged helix-turn-helix transcriptional regulator [Luteolibacter sp. AS25]|uniref:MarR family winged helix-turn-helix transcriptional regulator n=1 Tax=Luteolibacter sp. AS25 TaxID=3135776 RepID=UPI00398A510A